MSHVAVREVEPRTWSSGVAAITSAYHAEDRGFDSRLARH